MKLLRALWRVLRFLFSPVALLSIAACVPAWWALWPVGPMWLPLAAVAPINLWYWESRL